jgi:hypothetical protein
MRVTRNVLAAGILGLFTVMASPAAAQQRMACETTTITTTEYYSNGIIITYVESTRVCWPI